MRSRLLSVIIIVLLLSGVAYYYIQHSEVVHSEPKWDCEYSISKSQCNVSFEIINKTHMQQTRKVSIRAIRIPPNSKRSSLKIYGEELFDVTLQPLEIIKINEAIEVNGKPNEVTVKVWK